LAAAKARAGSGKAAGGKPAAGLEVTSAGPIDQSQFIKF
jgi:hypothetical protein